MRANKQQGSGLIVALFVIVAGATVIAAMSGVLGASQQSRSLTLNLMRAQQAGIAAAEWARYRIDRSGACVSGVLNLREGALSGFRATVSCARSTHNDGGTPRTVYALTVFAQRGQFGNPEYVSWRHSTQLQR
jgi:hypothetical protein